MNQKSLRVGGLLIALAVTTPQLLGQTRTWTGGGADGDWFNAANWSPSDNYRSGWLSESCPMQGLQTPCESPRGGATRDARNGPKAHKRAYGTFRTASRGSL